MGSPVQQLDAAVAATWKMWEPRPLPHQLSRVATSPHSVRAPRGDAWCVWPRRCRASQGNKNTKSVPLAAPLTQECSCVSSGSTCPWTHLPATGTHSQSSAIHLRPSSRLTPAFERRGHKYDQGHGLPLAHAPTLAGHIFPRHQTQAQATSGCRCIRTAKPKSKGRIQPKS
jgi:hypothetical protein